MNGFRAWVTSWVDAHADELAARGVSATLIAGPRERATTAVWTDFDTDQRTARVIVWDSGEAELVVGAFSSGDVIWNEHLTLTSEFGVAAVLEDAARWATGELRP